jgi:hypothetical protein
MAVMVVQELLYRWSFSRGRQLVRHSADAKSHGSGAVFIYPCTFLLSWLISENGKGLDLLFSGYCLPCNEAASEKKNMFSSVPRQYKKGKDETPIPSSQLRRQSDMNSSNIRFRTPTSSMLLIWHEQSQSTKPKDQLMVYFQSDFQSHLRCQPQRRKRA